MRVQKTENISLVGAIAIGIGGMVGGGIFAVLGEAVSLAGSATWIAFIVAGTVALLTAYSYSKLSVKYQNNGGTVVFIDNAFQHDLLSGSVNFLLWLSYIVTISLYAVAFAAYGKTFLSSGAGALTTHMLISGAILLPGVINLVNAAIVSKSETVIVIFKLTLLVIVIISGAFNVDAHRLVLSASQTPLSIVTAGMVIFVAYEGFELIANASGNITRPEVDLPRAFFGSVLIVIVLYALIAVITVGTVSQAELVKYQDYALAVAARPSLGEFGFKMVAVSALLATFSAINATVFGNARLGYIMAESGELPDVLDEEVRNIPDRSIYVTVVLSLLLSNSIDLSQIAMLGSASFLLVFFVINISAIRLHKEINCNRAIAGAAALMSLAALITLVVYTYRHDRMAVYIFLSFIAFSVLFEKVYGRFFRKKAFMEQTRQTV